MIIRQGKTGDGIHVQRRLIDGGSGYGAVQEPVAHFGLGEDARSPVEVTVRWPDGAVSVDMIDIDTMVMFDHPLGAAPPPTKPAETPREEKPEPAETARPAASRLPKPHAGAAALLGAMMGRRGRGNKTNNATAEGAATGKSSGRPAPASQASGRAKPPPKLAPGLARMLRRQ